MQTIKKVKYSIERVGNSTFCTMSCDLEYIMDYLEGANIKVSSADTSVFLKIATSKERKIFIKNLASWGLTVDNSTITVVAKITLNKNDWVYMFLVKNEQGYQHRLFFYFIMYYDWCIEYTNCITQTK